jgi:uncharacterized protein YidB (DUF937 family)
LIAQGRHKNKPIMALLDQILNGVTSLSGLGGSNAGVNGGANGGVGGVGGALLGGGSKAQLLRVLLQLLASGKLGGLDGLLNKFNKNGMQNQLASWVSTQPNEPVSPAQVEQALGTDTVSEIAQKAGMDQTQAAQGLSELIPQLVDKMTPTGTMPQQDVISGVFEKLGQRF